MSVFLVVKEYHDWLQLHFHVPQLPIVENYAKNTAAEIGGGSFDQSDMQLLNNCYFFFGFGDWKGLENTFYNNVLHTPKFTSTAFLSIFFY